MVRNEILAEIYKLDAADRKFIVEAVSATLPDEPEEELSQELKELLDRRLEAFRRDPSRGLTWEQVKTLLAEDRKKVRP